MAQVTEVEVRHVGIDPGAPERCPDGRRVAGDDTTLADQTKPLQCNAGQIDAFTGDLQPVDGSGMGQDHRHHADVDAERYRSCALVCTLATVLDELETIEVADLLSPEVALPRCECRRTGSRRGGFAQAHRSAMGRASRSPNLCRRATDDRLGGGP
ncbi:MAG: hypothetical protein MUF73_15270 [Rhodobacteraceae bacterium]|nr:hypothetical protein [Paracoccaceae bacterium]